MTGAALLSIGDDTEEICSLLQTLEIEVVYQVIQNRNVAHRNYYLGPGKIDEIKERVSEEDVDLVIVNGNLKPSQHHMLEMTFQKECIDRIGIILRIFAEHAHTEEAKNQVTLATLRYELPFLREWIHKAKSGERPGFLSGGAYATEVYFEHAKTHMKRIEENLEKLSVQREVRRRRRRKRGYFLVSLAGYTNAGKSAMLNVLCDTDIEVDDRLFSTLSTTTRKLKGVRSRILLTDTVGFIKDLPPDLVDAFNSTLEEIFYSDLILLLVDVSEPIETVKKKLETSLSILQPKLQGTPMVIVGNKIDLIPPSDLQIIAREVGEIGTSHRCLLASATTGAGTDDILEAIRSTENLSQQIQADLPTSDETFSLLSRLHEECEIDDVTTTDHVSISLRCSSEDVERITGLLIAAGGSIIENR